MIKYAFLALGVCYFIGAAAVSVMTSHNPFECLVVGSFGLVFIGIYVTLARIAVKG